MADRLPTAIDYVQREYIDTQPGRPDWALTAVLGAARRVEEAETERDAARRALSAYRSALRSGERETDQLRKLGEEGLG